MADYPLLLKRARAAELLGMSDDTLADWVRKGLVPADCMFRDPDGDNRLTWFRRDRLIAWATAAVVAECTCWHQIATDLPPVVEPGSEPPSQSAAPPGRTERQTA
jgi:hypothetical protein